MQLARILEIADSFQRLSERAEGTLAKAKQILERGELAIRKSEELLSRHHDSGLRPVASIKPAVELSETLAVSRQLREESEVARAERKTIVEDTRRLIEETSRSWGNWVDLKSYSSPLPNGSLSSKCSEPE